jgi:peptide chain release factor subunit 1
MLVQLTEEGSLARYEFRRKIEELRGIRGRATECISLYVPPTKQISDVTNYLRNEYAQASNIKSRTTKKNVTWAIESLIGRLKNYKYLPDNGVVLFVGHKPSGGDQSEPISYVIEPPEPFNAFLYRCDSTFYLDILEDMLTEKEMFGLLVIDRNEATIGSLKGKRITVIKNFESHVMGKHSRGGQSALRFERLIEIAAHEYYKKVANVINESFLNEPNLKGIIVGGPGPTKDFFVKEGYLHHELAKKVVNTFDTGYTNEYGLRELMEKASEVLTEMDLAKEKKLIHRFVDEIRKPDGGKAAYGEREVRHALELGAVDTLLVSEKLATVRLALKCASCGAEESATAKEVDSSAHRVCKACGGALSETGRTSLVSDMYKAAESVGTTIEMVSGDSEEGDMLMKAFGGIAAILRYRVT